MTAVVDGIVLSYLALRRMVGYVGAGLPFALVVGWLLLSDGSSAWPHSMSGFYWTSVGNVFVGALCAIGAFLFSYCGYARRDRVAARLASICAIGVAMFPVCPDHGYTALQQSVGRVHLACAALLFATLAYFSLLLFTSTDGERAMTPEKRKRNLVYRLCGWTIVACLVSTAVCEYAVGGHAVFFLEAVMVLAFGASWLTKGQAILADR